MFFTLSKIFWFVFSPLNLVLLLLLGGAGLTIVSRKLGRSVMVLGLFLFLFAGALPVGEKMLGYLESRHERPAVMPERVDGILVLGGTFMSGIMEKRGVMALNETGERVLEAMALAQQHPNAIVVFSGGNGRLSGRGRSEAEDVADFLALMDFPEEHVFYEDESRNTYENIRFSYRLMLPQPEETWLLVTSAYHMPRAMHVAKAAGWGDIIAYPVDYRTEGDEGWEPDGFDTLGHMFDFHVALHEYFGLLAYHMTKKISLP